MAEQFYILFWDLNQGIAEPYAYYQTQPLISVPSSWHRCDFQP